MIRKILIGGLSVSVMKVWVTYRLTQIKSNIFGVDVLNDNSPSPEGEVILILKYIYFSMMGSTNFWLGFCVFAMGHSSIFGHREKKIGSIFLYILRALNIMYHLWTKTLWESS